MKSFHQNTILQRVDCLLVYTEEQQQKFSAIHPHVFTLKSPPRNVASIVRKAKSIYIHPDGFDHWNDVLEVLHSQHPLPVKLFIFAGSDFSIEDAHIEFWSYLFPNAKFWIQNYIGNHSKCRIFPLGVNIPVELKEQEKTKPLVISYFNPLNSEERFNLEEYLKTNDTLTQYRTGNLPIQEFLHEISKGFFSVCPQGNGYDTYRFWESLSVGAIPIVLNNLFLECLMEQHPEIPFMVLEDWKDLPSFLHSDIQKVYDTFMKMSKLDILTEEYWIKEFESTVATSDEINQSNVKEEVSLSKNDEQKSE